MWEGLSGGCRAGLTLERCSQLAAFVTRPVGRDAAAVWLADDGVSRCAPLPSSNLVPFGRVAARERQGALSRRAAGSSLSGGYAPDSAKVEGSSIVDESG